MTDRFNAEIRLVFRDALPADLGAELQSYRRQPSEDIGALAARTSLRAADATIAKSVYAVENGASIWLYVPEDTHTLVILLERTISVSFATLTSETAEMQKRTVERIEAMERFAKQHRNKISGKSVDVTWGPLQMYRAEHRSFRARLLERAKVNVIARLSVPVAASIGAFVMEQDPKDVLKTFISAVAAIVIATWIEAMLEEKFKFEAAT